MESNKEIITRIIEDLDIQWSTRKNSKITKEKLIECWAEYRKEPEYKFYGYSLQSSQSSAYLKIFKNINKDTKEKWKNYILKIGGYKYCPKCTKLQALTKFSKSNTECCGLRSICKSCDSLYVKSNREVNNNSKAKRRAAKLKRTPSWSSTEDEQKIKDLYIKAKELEKKYNVKYHVDHIIPLQGKLVSGLHIFSNLQVITAIDNMSKSNTYNI